MENKKYLNKVVTIKMRNETKFQGVFIAFGEQWTLLKYIPVDYIIDGYVVLNNHYIIKIEISEDDSFTEKILTLKKISFKDDQKFNLDKNKNFLTVLKNQGNVIKIELKDHHKAYIGKLTDIQEKSMKVHLIDKRCNWIKEEAFLFSELRAIYLKDDYLDSLQLYLDKL